MRLLYEIKESNLLLWDVGSHSLVDNVHLRGFAANTRFSRLYEAAEVAISPSQPDEQKKSKFDSFVFKDPGPLPENATKMQEGSPNAFAFFQDAHLRILGVPSLLVKPLKKATSLEAALELPGLPEQTCMWLEELSTSTELEEVMFDSSRLLYRSTLDRFKGYCEGKIKRLMLNLQNEQQQYVDIERSPLILLKGAAGSGKTTVGIYRAIRLASQGLQHCEIEEAQLYIEQQRTLCYVGMTRAAEALYLLTVKGVESRFVKELLGKVVVWE